jgi:hypothetical protein
MTIFIHAYRSFSMRYITGTDILAALKDSGEQIVLFVHDNEVTHFQKLFPEKQITIEPVLYNQSVQNIRQNTLIRSLNLIRIMTSGSTANMFNHTINLRKIQYKPEFTRLRGKLVFKGIKLISWLTCHSYFIRKTLIFFISLILSGKMYDTYFTQYKPNLLLISSLGYGIDIAFMNSAKRHGCKIISIPHSWDNSSTKGYRGCLPDKVITWNDRMSKEIEAFHDINKDTIYSGGIAHWDNYLNKHFLPSSKQDFFKRRSLNNNKKLIFYGLSGPRHFERRFDVIEGILEAMLMNKIKPLSQLLVRFHPQHIRVRADGSSALSQYVPLINSMREKYGDLVHFWEPKQPHLNEQTSLEMTDMYEMAEAIINCDVVVQEYSTLIMESSLFNKPTINISMYNWDQGLPSDAIEGFTHLKHILSYKSVRTVRTFEEFTQIANMYLNEPEVDAVNRQLLFDNEIGVNRGLAGQSIGQYIINYMNDIKNIKTAEMY